MSWGPGAAQGFQNALMMGLQTGQMVRQRREEENQRNALADFVQNPSRETAAAVAPYNPQLAYQYGQDVRKAEGEAAMGQLVQRAMAGEPAAMTELAAKDFDTWSKLDERQKNEVATEGKLIGDIALDLRRTPYAARRDKFIAYSQQFPQFADKLNELAFLPEQEQALAIDGYALRAGLVGRLVEMDAPNYRNLGPGEVLVNMNDPEAIGQFASGGQQGGAQYQEGDTAINPSTGQRIVFRNGNWSPM